MNKIFYKALVALALICLLLAGAVSCKSAGGKNMDIPVAKDFVYSEVPTDYVDIMMDSGEHIIINLLPDDAPITVANFQKLVSEKFYDGVIFHRIIDGFMIQGGDPNGTGMGGAKEKIKGEFKNNGVGNGISHIRGIVSMARSSHPDSASSQFFICNGNAKFLDGDYAGFGYVVHGMEEVDRIAKLAKDGQDRPLEPPVMKQVVFVIPQGGC